MNSIEHLPFSRLICPTVRFEFNKRHSCKQIYHRFRIIDNSDDFSYIKDDNSSHSRHHLYPLFWCNNKEYFEDEFRCHACRCKSIGTTYYFCMECEFSYHKECVESPPLIKSLYHRKHNLQLLVFNRFVDFNSFIFKTTKDMTMSCCHCGSNNLWLFYHCSLCNFSIDLVCARKPPILTYEKRHEHTLNYFPRKTNLICDVCGLVDDNNSLIYVCLQCDFVVHKTCIYLPFIIRISRHEHRISFTYSSPSRKLFCGVCRQNVEENCGKYSCMKDCTYVVHSKCATRKDVWDGKELEDKPEEVYESLNSFEVIGDRIIQHFSHPHHMIFENGKEMPYDEKKKCEACVLPLYDGDVYKCMDSKCDFILHETCANLPRTRQHIAYPYPLTLQISDSANLFFCGLCKRYSCGFKYVIKELWRYTDMGVDVRCASISEPFHHQCHPMHPLFLTTLGISKTCSMCIRKKILHLNCLECDFVSCFICATLPYKVRYEHDEHFLTLSYEENASLNWCEVCEKRIDSSEWLYTCNECGVALHIHCLRGQKGSYLKPAQNIRFAFEKINIVSNYDLTRPICYRCGTHCQDKIRFERHDGKIFCSYWEVPNIHS